MKRLNEFLNEGKKFKNGNIVVIKKEFLDDPSEEGMEYKVVNVNNGTKKIIIEPVEFDGGAIKPEQVVGMNMVELKESVNEGKKVEDIVSDMLDGKIEFKEAMELANKLPRKERLEAQRKLRFYLSQEQ